MNICKADIVVFTTGRHFTLHLYSGDIHIYGSFAVFPHFAGETRLVWCLKRLAVPFMFEYFVMELQRIHFVEQLLHESARIRRYSRLLPSRKEKVYWRFLRRKRSQRHVFDLYIGLLNSIEIFAYRFQDYQFYFMLEVEGSTSELWVIYFLGYRFLILFEPIASLNANKLYTSLPWQIGYSLTDKSSLPVHGIVMKDLQMVHPPIY